MDETSDPRQGALVQAMEAFGRAWAQGDMDRLRALLSPSYTHNDVFGAHLPHDAWLDYAAKRQGRATRIAFREVKTRFLGDLAIVTGFNDITGGGATAPGDSQDMTIVFTQVWRWDDGQWKREAFQATEVRPRQAG